MAAKLYFALISLVALINVLPALGVLSKAHLESAYGVSIDNANLEILLRHRAVLFGLIGGLLVYSLFHPAIHTVALLMVTVSMASFIAVVLIVQNANSALLKIVIADLIGIALVAVALTLKFLFIDKTGS